MKYIYPYECEKLKLSSPAELQMAIDGNRREGRRPSYGGYDFPPSGDGFLASPLSALANGRQASSPAPSSRSREMNFLALFAKCIGPFYTHSYV